MKRRIITTGLCGLVCSVLIACSPKESVQVYTTPKQAKIAPLSPGGASGDATDTTQQQMLGAIVPASDQIWFFKVTGPGEQVAGQARRFVEFVRSLKFDSGGEPTWTLPEGWKQEPGSGMRFATLRIDTSGQPLELSVIPLSIPDENEQDYVLSNINRWRGQLGLAPLEKEELPSNSVQIELEGVRATLVNLVGTRAGADMRRPPFADHPPISGTPASAAEEPAGSKPGTEQTDPPRAQREQAAGLSYVRPAGWEPGRSGGMRKAAFNVKDGDAEVEITVIDLSADAGDLLPNINRWRGQVGVAPITKENLPQESRPIDVGGVAGTLVEIIGSDSAQPGKAILGVIAVHGDRSWFIKLMGDATLATRQREHFEAFVRSIQFGGGKEG